MEMARFIAKYHATRTGNLKKAALYREKNRAYQEIYLQENYAMDRFFEILSSYVNDKSYKEHIYELADNYLKELAENRPEKVSLNYLASYYGIEAMKYLGVQDYQKAADVCKTALAEINELPFTAIAESTFFLSQLITCNIQLKQFAEGKDNMDAWFVHVERGTYDWFKGMELSFKLSCYTKKYTEAWEVYKKVIGNSQFENLPANVREIWNINYAYIRFLIGIGKVDLTFRERIRFEKEELEPEKLMNQVYIYSKDKKGLNVTILVIFFLMLLLKKDYDKIVGVIGGFKKYRYRYLDKNNNYRSYLFASMLLVLAKYRYSKKLVIEKTRDLFEKLQSIPVEINNEEHDVEVLPYEDSWRLMLSLLK